jgi:hypothetical protein
MIQLDHGDRPIAVVYVITAVWRLSAAMRYRRLTVTSRGAPLRELSTKLNDTMPQARGLHVRREYDPGASDLAAKSLDALI